MPSDALFSAMSAVLNVNDLEKDISVSRFPKSVKVLRLELILKRKPFMPWKAVTKPETM